MNAHLLTVGDELLLGQVVDTNAAFIGQYLEDHGGRLVRHHTVGDVHEHIVADVRAALQAPDTEVVLVTGGLGPTEDDLTLAALAEATGRAFVFNEETYARIEHIFREVIRRPLSASHRRQAYQPEGARTLPNRQGTAPGILVEHGTKTLVAMPGVPREMRALMEDAVVPELLRRHRPRLRRHDTITLAGYGETQLADAVAEVVKLFPPEMSIAYLPSLGTVRLRTTAWATEGNLALLDELLGEQRRRLLERLPQEAVVGYGTTDLLTATHDALSASGLAVATAESCTGGSLGRALTALPGASAYYVGGIVAYSNALKVQLLGVSPETLEDHGAVSEETAREMVEGLLQRVPADLAIATTGIAGPDGGTPDKPVGTVWIAIGTRQGVHTRLLSLGRDRRTNIDYTVNAALDALRRQALGLTQR